MLGVIVMIKLHFDFLNQTFYGLDVMAMLNNVIDFLEFSEGNLAWQRRREVRRAEVDALSEEFSPEDLHLRGQYIIQTIEDAEYRFDVNLSQSIRYSGLTALTTTLEWCGAALMARLVGSAPKVPEGENKFVSFFSHLNSACGLGHEAHIANMRRLVHVRNCIVHSAGFLKGYKFEREVRETIKHLPGFSVNAENYLGESVEISNNALPQFARAAFEWIPTFEQPSIKAGILK